MNFLGISETTIVVIAAIGGWLTAALGWFKWWYEIREKNKEKAAKEKAEKELREIKRRGDAPYLVPNDALFNGIYISNGPGQVGYMTPFHSALLYADRKEVGPDTEGDVVFLVENQGRPARAVTIKLDGEEISIEKEADLNDAHGYQFIVYPYHKEKHGKEQIISISFESSSGVHDTHYYKTRHGFRILKRADPDLPK
jgi:hypothetical protein